METKELVEKFIRVGKRAGKSFMVMVKECGRQIKELERKHQELFWTYLMECQNESDEARKQRWNEVSQELKGIIGGLNLAKETHRELAFRIKKNNSLPY